MKKIIKIVIWSFILVLIIAGIYKGFIKEEPEVLILTEVIQGDVYQEILETGTIVTGNILNLNFKIGGKIKEIFVNERQSVKRGDILAKLDNQELQIQLREIGAALELAEAGLNRLLAGVSQEEIDLVQTAVVNAEIALIHAKQNLSEKIDLSKTAVANVGIALSRAKQNLEDVRVKTDISHNQVYEDALNVLDTAYLKLYNTHNVVDRIQRAYFTRNNQEGIRVRGNEKRIEDALNNVRDSIQVAKNGFQEEIAFALVETRNALSTTVDALGIIREICETPVYRHLISQVDKTALDMERTKINTILIGIIDIQQAVLLTKETNKIKITSAQAKIDSIKGQLQAVKDTNKISISGARAKVDSINGHLQTAKNTLVIKEAGARQVDIAIHNAQIRQVKARKELLEEQIQESVLRSPVDGIIVSIAQGMGEVFQPMMSTAFISLIPVGPFQIETYIFEEDIVKIEVGDIVEITLIAFPDELLTGRVTSINPMERLIGGVVHYKVAIDFDEDKQGIKRGMTVDIIIKTEIREDVLIIDEDAIQRRDEKFIVQIYKNGLIQERIVEIGLRGDDDMVEIISGLREGEKIIMP